MRTTENRNLIYCGRPVEDLTREELIEALYTLKREMDRARELHKQERRMLCDIGRARANLHLYLNR